MRIRIYPYRGGSASARALSTALGARVIRRTASRWRPRRSDVVINWGYSGMELADLAYDHVGFRLLNDPGAVIDARDKVRTLAILSANGVPTVEWTTNPQAAETWWRAGNTVFVRNTTTGQGGSGIYVMDEEDVVGDYEHATHEHFPIAPLYTKRFNARHEYRVHVVGDDTFVVKKRRREGVVPNPVRNHENGYVYCTNNVTAPDSVVAAALAAVRALSLDFGAVDVMCTDAGEARVLEVNTAPGIEGRTVDFYATKLTELIGRAA